MTSETPRTAQSPNASYFAGLDVHQKTCDIALVDPVGRIARRWHLKTCPAALDLFARELRKECAPLPVALGLEASTAGKAVFLHLRQLGLDVHMGHPLKLESIRSSESKTDRNDAEELARLLQCRHFPESYVPTEELDQLRNWVRVREEQVEKLRRVKMQVRSLLVKHHLQHEATKYSDIFGVQALHWLEKVELENPAHRRQLQVLLEEGALLVQQVESLTMDLAREAAGRKEVELLQSIPGIDYVLGLTIVAEVGDVRRFPNRKKFAAYCGVVPRNRDSGGRVATHAPVRHGNSRLKWALDIATQSHVLRIRRGRLFQLFETLKARVGVPKALTAIAHRLAFVIYGIWKSGAPYAEGNPASFERKREKLAMHARAVRNRRTVPQLVEQLLSRPSISGVSG
jgi:transposase